MKGTKSRDALVISKRFFISVIALATVAIPTLSVINPEIASADPSITEYPITSPSAGPDDITTGPDGNLWFTETSANNVGKISTTGQVKEYSLPLPNSDPMGITTGPDGNLWFTQYSSIGEINPSTGVVSVHGDGGFLPSYITTGPDGALWYVAGDPSGSPTYQAIGRMTSSGQYTVYYDDSEPNYSVSSNIVVGADGNMWFVSCGGSSSMVSRITSSGVITNFTPPSSSQGCLEHVISGPDGNLWFTGYNSAGTNFITSMSTSGTFLSTYQFPGSTANIGEFTGLTTGSDGNMWAASNSSLARITTSGEINEYDSGSPMDVYRQITNGPDGNLWFTDAGTNTINKVTPQTAPTITSSSSYSTGMRTPITPSDFTVTTAGTSTATITESGALPAGISFVDNGDGTANFTGMASGNPASNGTYPITITATNSAGSTTQGFTLTITTATSPPTFISSNTATESFGVPFSYTVVTTGYPVPSSLHKVEGDGSLPPGVSFVNNGDGTGTLSGTPDNTADGPYTFTLEADNGIGTATQVFTMTITKAPVFKDVRAGQSPATVGSAYSLPITATGTLPIIMTESGTLPNGLSFTDSGGGNATISGTPATGSGGSYPVTVTATNAYGTSTTSFTVKVDEAPTITSADNATATVGSDFYFPVTALGYPAPNYTLTGTLPAGLHFYPGPGTFGGTPEAGTEGTYPVTITATNSFGTYTQDFVLTVEGSS